MLEQARFFVIAALIVGCGGTKKPAEEPTTAKAEIATEKEDFKVEKPTAKNVPNTPTASGVNISDAILKACGIKEADAYFAFDSTKIVSAGPLDKVAECFMTGPLKGRAMKLVGHADPRGDADYNVQLGLSRADSVAKYMFDKGLDKKQASTTSRGAMDAKGTDDASWALDRRVDVVLAE
jgi:peptidoglycan-associated lipoprotein